MAYPYDDSDPFAQPDQHFQPPPYGHIHGEPLPLFPYGYPMVAGPSMNTRPGQQDETSSNPSSGTAQDPHPGMHQLQDLFNVPGDEHAGGPLAEVAEVIQSWYGAQAYSQDTSYTPWMPSPNPPGSEQHEQHRSTPPVPPPLQQPHPEPEQQQQTMKNEPNDNDPLAYLNGLTKSDYNPFAMMDQHSAQPSPSHTSLQAPGTWRMTVDPFPFSSGLEGASGVPLQSIQHTMRPDVLAKHHKDVEEVSAVRRNACVTSVCVSFPVLTPPSAAVVPGRAHQPDDAVRLHADEPESSAASTIPAHANRAIRSADPRQAAAA